MLKYAPTPPYCLTGLLLGLLALPPSTAEAGPLPRRATVLIWDLPTTTAPARASRQPRSLWDIPTRPQPAPTPTANVIPVTRWPAPSMRRPPAWRSPRRPGYPVAERWRALAEVHGARFGLNPALVLAVIHAESAGNPAARSPKNACGLMQLVPTAGGRDARRLLTGDPTAGPPSAEESADPESNIQMGTAYLWQLLNRELADLAGLPWAVRRDLALAAYNWGPDRVRRRLVGDSPPMTVAEVRARLVQWAPAETQGYVQRVNALLALYGGDGEPTVVMR